MMEIKLTDVFRTDLEIYNKSSAVAEMGDRGHNRYGPKRGGGAAVPLSPIAGNPSNTKWPGPRSTSVPSYQVTS